MKGKPYWKDIEYWIRYIAYDLRVAKASFKEGLFSAVCFTAHQIVEKSLKSVLLFHGIDITLRKWRVHDLVKLQRGVSKLDGSFKRFSRAVNFLNDFYIQTRYPGDWPGPEGLASQRDARQALKYAKKVYEFVARKFPISSTA